MTQILLFIVIILNITHECLYIRGYGFSVEQSCYYYLAYFKVYQSFISLLGLYNILNTNI